MSSQTNQKKKRMSTGLVVLLIVFITLFLLTTAILGARLYELATRDQYTVDLSMGELDGSIELFKIEYQNELGEITVKGANADNVVAPGTSVNYDIRLRNNDDVVIDFLMTPTVEFLTADAVPVQFKVVDDYGNYIVGSQTRWANPAEMNELAHKGSIHPGEVFTYHVSWQWEFEVSDGQNGYDTYLGNQNGEPGVKVGIETQASANTDIATKDITHMSHLLGESFGCCWCCWLVWLLVLVCLLLTLWVWKLKRKLRKLEEEKQELEETAQIQ